MTDNDISGETGEDEIDICHRHENLLQFNRF